MKLARYFVSATVLSKAKLVATFITYNMFNLCLSPVPDTLPD